MDLSSLRRAYTGHVPDLMGARGGSAVLVPLVDTADGPSLLYEIRSATVSYTHLDGEILIIVAGRLEGEGDLVARLAAGNRVGQQTAIRCEILLGKCDIRAGADAVFTVIAPRLSAGKPRPVWFCLLYTSP